VNNDDLIAHFSTYGEVTAAQVKFDRATGRSRGFAFVEFATTEFCKLALEQREQTIKNKQCEIKPAKSRENKKVFVGGLPADHPEEELRKHFEEFGKVEDIEWPYDKTTKARRNFAFIVFEEEEAADRAASLPKQVFGSRECDVKKAVPQNKRALSGLFGGGGGIGGGMMGGGRMPALRGAFGAPNMRGGPGISMAAQWFNGWPQMTPGMGGYGGAGPSAGGWGDWYSSGAANYYAQPNNTATFGAFNSGYEYASQASVPARQQPQQHQNGSSASSYGSQRYLPTQPQQQPQF